MVATVGSLRVNLFADLAEFRKGFGEANKTLTKFGRQADQVGKNLQSFGAKLSVGVTAPLTLFGREAVKAARDAEELQSAFNFSFGDLAGEVNKFAQETGDALGRSTQQLQQQAFEFNQLFKTALDPRDAADLSKQFTILTNDLASFFNVADDDALNKLRAGLVGEAEPLRKFGVFLSAARVEAKAFELGLVSANGELTEQNKILARAAIIMEDTKDAQGDLARTSDSFANRQKALNAELQELAVIAGRELLPALTELIRFLVDAIQRFKSLDPEVQKNVVRFAAIAAAAGPVLIALGTITRTIIPLAKAFGALLIASRGLEANFGRLRLGVLGTATAFAGLLPVAIKAGQQLGKFAAEQENFVNGLILIRATLPKTFGGLGVSLDEARVALGKVRAEQRRQAEEAENQRQAAVNLRDASLDSLDKQLKATKELTDAEAMRAQQQAAQSAVLAQGAFDDILAGIDQGAGGQVQSEQQAIKELGETTTEAFDMAGKSVDNVRRALDGFREARSPVEDIRDILKEGSRDLAESIARFRSLGDVARRVGAAIAEALVIQPFINSLTGLFQGGFGGLGGIVGGLFGGGRADGGSVNPRQVFMVGERGPELFVPPSAGRIVPNRDMMTSGGGPVTVNQTIVARDPNAFRSSQRQIARETRRNLGIA